MSEFLSSNPDEFDNQINDTFGGIGKQRTVLSGTWRKWINEECEDTGWECLAAWDNGNGLIVFNMQDPSGAEGLQAIEKQSIDRVHAVRTFAAIRYLHENPRPAMLRVGYEAPNHIANPNLYKELLSLGFKGDGLIDEYELLGGEYLD